MNNRAPRPVFEIVYVDDNPCDQFIMQHTVFTANIPLNLQFFSSANDALVYLKDELLLRPEAKRPALLISDYNMPEVRGDELAAMLRQIPHYHTLPIIICSASERPEVPTACYAAGATCFIRKTLSNTRQFAFVEALYSSLVASPTDFRQLRNLQEFMPPGRTLELCASSGCRRASSPAQ